MKKWHSQSLSSSKVAYARDEDPADSVIIRNVYPKICDSNRVFGIRGIVHIQNLFLSMLSLYAANLKTLRKKVKYVKKEEFIQLQDLLRELDENTNKFVSIYGLKEKEDHCSIRFPCDNGYVNVTVSAKADFPYLCLCNEDNEKKFITCTYLFIGEGITLMKYLNTRFNFTSTNLFKFVTVNEKLKTDNFF